MPLPDPGEAELLAALASPLRLAAVARTDVLDTPPEEAFDRLSVWPRR